MKKALITLLFASYSFVSFSQFILDRGDYFKLGINTSNEGIYICSFEFPRPTFMGEEEIDGPLEYNTESSKFVLNDSIYVLNPTLKSSSYCFLDVPTYILNYSSNEILYTYYSDDKIPTIAFESSKNKNLGETLKSLEFFGAMNQENLKDYLVNIYYGLSTSDAYIPVEIRDTVRFRSYVFLYRTTTLRSVLFPEYGHETISKRVQTLQEVDEIFSKLQTKNHKSVVTVKLKFKSKPQGGVYIAYKNGRREYLTLQTKKVKLKYKKEDITTILIDYNGHKKNLIIL